MRNIQLLESNRQRALAAWAQVRARHAADTASSLSIPRGDRTRKLENRPRLAVREPAKVSCIFPLLRGFFTTRIHCALFAPSHRTDHLFPHGFANVSRAGRTTRAKGLFLAAIPRSTSPRRSQWLPMQCNAPTSRQRLQAPWPWLLPVLTLYTQPPFLRRLVLHEATIGSL